MCGSLSRWTWLITFSAQGQNRSHFEPKPVPPPIPKKCDWEIEPAELDFPNGAMIRKVCIFFWRQVLILIIDSFEYIVSPCLVQCNIVCVMGFILANWEVGHIFCQDSFGEIVKAYWEMRTNSSETYSFISLRRLTDYVTCYPLLLYQLNFLNGFYLAGTLVTVSPKILLFRKFHCIDAVNVYQSQISLWK